MPDSPLNVITSPDGSSWGRSNPVANGNTDYGLQMAVYRGELYGVMTSQDKKLFATKYKIGSGWKSFRSLPEKYLSQGRATVTVLEDRFFIVRRGTNDAVYLLWTDDFDTFHDVGRVGSQYAKTVAAPAIAAHDGRLHIVGVGPDQTIYHTVANKDGQRETSWIKVPGTGTQSALTLSVYNGALYLLHAGYKGNKFYYQSLQDDGSWSKLASVTNNVTSGLSATSWKYNTLVVTYRGKDNDIKWQAFDGKDWSKKQYIPDVYMKYQTGLSTWAGQLVVSYAADNESSTRLGGYETRSLSMSEKGGLFGTDQTPHLQDWECKWKQDTQAKTWVQKMFCL